VGLVPSDRVVLQASAACPPTLFSLIAKSPPASAPMSLQGAPFLGSKPVNLPFPVHPEWVKVLCSCRLVAITGVPVQLLLLVGRARPRVWQSLLVDSRVCERGEPPNYFLSRFKKRELPGHRGKPMPPATLNSFSPLELPRGVAFPQSVACDSGTFQASFIYPDLSPPTSGGQRLASNFPYFLHPKL